MRFIRTAFLLLAVMGAVGAHAQRTVTASTFAGSDLGAQINAADDALGSGAGMIVVSAAGTVSTPVHVGANHALKLQAPTRWNKSATLRGNNAITCAGQPALLTVQLGNDVRVFNAKSVNNITMDGCWAQSVGPDGASYLLFVRHADHVTVRNSHTIDLGLLHALTGSDAPPETVQMVAHDINVSNSVVDCPTQVNGQHRHTGVLLQGVIGAHISKTTFHGMIHGVQYWGGDSNRDIRDKNAPRWVRDVVMADNTCSDVGGSCYWGSMGQNIQFLRNRAERCGDACLDVEGDVNDLADGNTVIDGNLGILMRNNHLEYRNNTVITTHGDEVLVHISNNVPNGNDNLDIFIHDNVFECQHPDKMCNIEFQDVQNFQFVHNKVTNGIVHPYARQQSGTIIANNTFIYDHSNTERFAAIDASWQVNGAQARVVDNTVISNAQQPAESGCIFLMWADTGAPVQYFATGNTCGGSHPFPVDLYLVSDGSRASGVTFHVNGNHFANRNIVEKDDTHVATFDVHQ